MSASDPQGGQKFWFNGVPFPGIKTGNDTGTVKFWFNGVPAGYVFPATGGVSIFPAAAALQLAATTPRLNITLPAAGSLALTTTTPIVNAETLFPVSDASTGTWTNESGGLPLWPSIDETVPDDADYIQSAQSPVNDLCKIGLSAPPDTLTNPFNIFYRIKKDITGDQINLTVALLQGATQIASWTHANLSTAPVTVQQILTAPQLASISDFTNLFVTFDASTYTGPGDLVSGAVGAWALRAWSRSTIGSRAIRLIASSDTGLTGNSSDFVTLADGSLDVASIAIFQAANPGTTLFVTKFYDQTLSGKDLRVFAQVDHYFPKFKFAGYGSRPVIFLDNLNMNLTSSSPTFTISTPITLGLFFNYDEVFPGIQPFNLETSAPTFTQIGFQLNKSGTNLNKILMTTAVGASLDSGTQIPCSDFDWHSVIGVFDAASSVGYVDGVGTAQPTMIARSADPNAFVGLFGSPFGGNAMSGRGVEGFMYNRALSPTEIASITTNQRSYWVFPYTGPGDLIAGAIGWWGLRAYSAATIGTKAIQLIASSDTGLTGNTSDFVTLADGSLDVASIAAFLAANPGKTLYVKTLYDQTGNGFDLTSFAQTNNYVPKFQLAGLGALPVILQDNSNMNLTSGLDAAPRITAASPITIVAVVNSTSPGGQLGFELNEEAGNADRVYGQFNFGGTHPDTINLQESVATTFYVSSHMACTDSSWHSIAAVYNAASSVGYVDGSGTAFASAVALPSHSTYQFGAFGSAYGSSSMIGKGVECGLWPSAFSATQTAAINANQRAYWGF